MVLVRLWGLLWALVLAIPASAATVFVQFDPAYSTPITVDRTVDGGLNWFLQDPGQFHFLTQPGGPADIPLDFYTFCIEPREFLSPGQFVTYNISPLEQGATNIGGMGTAKASLLNELLARNYPNFSVAVSLQMGAALQVAIWEIVREDSGTLNLDTGNVQYRTWSDLTVYTLAQQMLSQLTGTGPYLDNIQALTLAGGTQDILVQTPLSLRRWFC